MRYQIVKDSAVKKILVWRCVPRLSPDSEYRLIEIINEDMNMACFTDLPLDLRHVIQDLGDGIFKSLLSIEEIDKRMSFHEFVRVH